MVNIIRTRQNSGGGSPRAAAEVGEVDTKAPFQSVRAAVSLFGEASSPKSKPLLTNKKAKSQTEGVLDKEAQFHLTLNELNKLKEQLRGAEFTKAETLPELDKAKRTLQELKDKLKAANESKQYIFEATEALKIKARKLDEAKSNNQAQVPVDGATHDVDTKREEYKAAIAELDAAKQELSNLRRDFDEVLEAKLAAFKHSEAARVAADAHRERVTELSKQVAAMREALAKMKASFKEAVEEHEKSMAKKDGELQSRRLDKERVEKKLLALKSEHGSLIADNLEGKLTETHAEIRSLQEKVEKARAAFSEAQRRASSELETARVALKQVVEEKTMLESSVESLKRELEQVGKELWEEKRKEEELESLASRVRAELEDRKTELRAGLVNKTTAADASDGMFSTMEQLGLETEKAKREAEEMKREKEKLEQEVKTAQEMTVEIESKLSSLLKQAEESKALEKAAQEEVKALSEKAEADVALSSESNGKVKLSKEEYNSLMERVKESERMAEMKVAAAMVNVEAVGASESETTKKIEASLKEIEELKTSEEEALKCVEMAEAATRVLESELHRRHQQEQ